MIRCPLCHRPWRDLFCLALHVEDEHADEQHRIAVVLIESGSGREIDDRQADLLHAALAEQDSQRFRKLFKRGG